MYFALCVFSLVFQDDVAGCFEYYADLAEGLDAKQKAPVSLPMQTFGSYVLKEPIGVVALITPWYLVVYLVICWCLFVLFYFIFIFVVEFTGLVMSTICESFSASYKIISITLRFIC